MEEELPMENVIDPLDNDVLCGRGGICLRHTGNKTYHALVKLNRGRYTTCTKKTEKVQISRSIVAAIREQNGRFLEKNEAGTWDDIGDKRSYVKTSHALRDCQPKLKHKIAQFGGSAAALAQNQGYRHSDGNLAAAAAVAFDSNEYSQYEPHSPLTLDQQTANAFRNHQLLSRPCVVPLMTMTRNAAPRESSWPGSLAYNTRVVVPPMTMTRKAAPRKSLCPGSLAYYVSQQARHRLKMLEAILVCQNKNQITSKY
jgi:hypothetical protein